MPFFAHATTSTPTTGERILTPRRCRLRASFLPYLIAGILLGGTSVTHSAQQEGFPVTRQLDCSNGQPRVDCPETFRRRKRFIRWRPTCECLNRVPHADCAPHPLRQVTAVPESLRTELKLSEFYQQHVDARGLPIVASGRVSPAALLETAFLIDRMLEGRDDLRRAMASAGVRVTVMATNEFTTDVPEHADLQPALQWNARARGLGATRHRPSVSCGEENLLALPGDPYHGENILIHEFAHTIHQMGLASVDRTFETRLREAYTQALQQGLWKGTYAATNHHEYWAEGVQSWFDCNRAPDRSHNEIRTRAAIQEYDPGLAALLAEVFGERAWRYQSPRERTCDPHLRCLDWSSLPRFDWPEELRQFKQRLREKDERKTEQKTQQKTEEKGEPKSE